MFKLESNRLKREFKIVNGNFFASQILNKYSGMSFIPDGNGCEFVIRFADGGDFSAKGLPVIGSSEEQGKLKFIFAETQGVSVTLEYWVHPDGNTICKQLTLTQTDDRVIDFVFLDSIGIINSKTHLGVNRIDDSVVSPSWAALGQPFYIDSLFFGCENPATDNRIVHGTGRVKYYIGKNVGRNFACPVTVMGAAKDNTVTEVKKAFFEYLDFISVKSPLRFQFNSWYDNFTKISAESIKTLFAKINDGVRQYNLPPLDSYTVDDGWCSYKADFWKFNKGFPNGLDDIKEECNAFNSGLGLWLSPRGGYSKYKKFAKKIQSAGNGFINKNTEAVCVASTIYLEKLGNYLCEVTNQYSLSYLKLDGFALKPCSESNHGHAVGGNDDMYFVTDMWQKWIDLFERLRASGEAGKNVFINMTCFANLSPWWLQWVNYLWLQNSEDIGFSNNLESQSKLDAELTYRDARYYDALCVRSAQLPLGSIYNHEPIFANKAKSEYGVNYTDEEFKKYLFWNAARGAGLNELHLSPEMMNEAKWLALKEAILFEKENFEILKGGMFIGGNPEDNNIYGYTSWDENENGIVALRNPTDEKTALTLTFNSLMGVPETLDCVMRKNIYCNSFPEDGALISYNDKLDLTLHPFEIIILKFTK